MAKGFRRVDRGAVMLLPPDLLEWLPDDHPARLVIELVEQFDLSELEAAYSRGGRGRQAYDPQMMCALLIYAYCRGVRSSRAIEAACLTDVAFMVITARQRPDHVTIARFRATHAQALARLFGQLLAICAREGMVKLGVVAIDGTKIAANASPRANRGEDSLRRLAAETLAEAAVVDAAEDAEYGADNSGDELPPSLRPGPDRRERIKKALDSIEAEKADRVRADVDKAKHRLGKANSMMATARRRAERVHAGRSFVRADRRPVDEHAEVKAAADKINAAEAELAAAQSGNGHQAATGHPIRRNTTDPDSRLMPNKSKGFLQGYNTQLAVSDDHLIIAFDVTNRPNDLASYQPMVDQTIHNVATQLPDHTLGTLLFDAGYCSVDNLTAAGPDRLIATGRDPAKPHQNKALQQMAHRLEDGTLERLLYKRRQATVEPVNAHLKDRIGLHRFSRRGLQAARDELGLAAIAHNIRRIASHRQLTPTTAS